MSFDPSVLSDIQGPDIAGSMAKGFQLKDMINDEQLSTLKLAGAKQEQSDQKTIKGILSSSDISSEKGIAEASEKLTRAGQPDEAMKLRKYGQSVVSGELDNQIKQVEIADKAQGAVVSVIDPIVATADEMRRAGKSDAMIQAYITAQTPLAMQNLQAAGLPPQALQGIMKNLSGGPITYDKLKAFETQSKQGQAAIKSRLDELRVNTAAAAQTTRDRSEDEKERHDRVTEDTARKKEAIAENKAKGFDDRESELLASLADRNVSLPAGLRSQAQIKSTIDGLFAKHPDQTADQIADGIKSGKLKLTAETKGASVAGTQIGKVALATNELNTFGDQTLEASSAVPRGKFVPWNRLKQMADSKISDPALLRFKAKMQALENAYNQLAGRSGTDVEKRAHIHELFDNANSPEAVKTLVQALNEEASGAKVAADKTIAETSGSAIPGAGPASHPSDIQSLLDKYK